MAAAQVVHFRSESNKSPVVQSSSPSPVLATAGSKMPSNFDNVTALMLACQQGRPDDVQKILRQKKLMVKERTRGGKMALHYCAESGSVKCLELVMAVDPFHINAQDEEGYTPLHLAVITGNRDAVLSLISAGADVNCLDNERHSLVHWATVCGEVEILDVLLGSGAPATTPDIHLAHPMHYAAQMCGSVNGVNSGSRARVQSTVYGVSPKKGLAILRRLIQHGAPVDVRDQDGRQPLLWASSAGSGDAILSLVNAGAKVDAEDKDGLTALHCAASRGHTDCLETLIALCGAEVDVIDNNGCTSLFYAVTLGHADCTELLLNYGAEPNRQDRKGRTPAHCGASKGQLETIKLLSKHGGNLWLRNVRGDLPLHEAVISRRKDLVLWLLAQRPDAVNAANNDGRCPIHLAALNNNVEMVKILIDYRADLNILMRSGKGGAMTALDAAMFRGNSAVAKFLQLHGGLPANSLNDAALQRRLNRSVESQVSGMQSHLSSHHHPSPDDARHNFTSPEIFDSSLVQYGRSSVAAASSLTHQRLSPAFIATSTPIMDDGVQTDSSHYVRHVDVQVSDDFAEEVLLSRQLRETGEVAESHLLSSQHRKAERRRRRRSPREEATSTDSSSTEKSQITPRTTKKSSRKSRRDSGDSGSKKTATPHSSHRHSGETELKLKSRGKSRSKSREERDSRSCSKEKTGRQGVMPQDSSDAILDNTMMSEKFSELEAVAVNSSETEAREEDLVAEDEKKVNSRSASRMEGSQSRSSSTKNDTKSEDGAEQSKSDSSPSKSSAAESKSADEEEKTHSYRKNPKAKSKSKSRSLSKHRRSKSRDVKADARSSSAAKSSTEKSEDQQDYEPSTNNRTRSPSSKRSGNSILKSRTPSGKRSSVSWHDDESKSRNRSLSSTKVADRDRSSQSKSVERTQSRSRSSSTSKRNEQAGEEKAETEERSEDGATGSDDDKEEQEAGKKSPKERLSRKDKTELSNARKKKERKSKSRSSSTKRESDSQSSEKTESSDKNEIVRDEEGDEEGGKLSDSVAQKSRSSSKEIKNESKSPPKSRSQSKELRRSLSKDEHRSQSKELPLRSRSISLRNSVSQDSGAKSRSESKEIKSRSQSKDVRRSESKEIKSRSQSKDVRRSESKEIKSRSHSKDLPRSESKEIKSRSQSKDVRRSESKEIKSRSQSKDLPRSESKEMKSRSQSKDMRRSESKEIKSRSQSKDLQRSESKGSKSRSQSKDSRRSKSKSLSPADSKAKRNSRSVSKEKGEDGDEGVEDNASTLDDKSGNEDASTKSNDIEDCIIEEKSENIFGSSRPDDENGNKGISPVLEEKSESDVTTLDGEGAKEEEEEEETLEKATEIDEDLSVKEDRTEEDLIEAGKHINLQEAAARRQSKSNLPQKPPVANQRSIKSRSRSMPQSRNPPGTNGTKVREPISKRTSRTTKESNLSTNKYRSRSISSSRSREPSLGRGRALVQPTNRTKTSEEREIELQEELLALRRDVDRRLATNQRLRTSRNRGGKATSTTGSRKSSREGGEREESPTVGDSGFSDQVGVTTSASEEHVRLRQGMRSNANIKRRVNARRPASGSVKRKSIFSSSAKKPKGSRERAKFDSQNLVVAQVDTLGLDPADEPDESISTGGGSVTSEELEKAEARRRRAPSRPRSKLTFSRGEDIKGSESRTSPRPKKNTDIDTPVSVTQAMQASMRKYQLERTIFQELLELKRLQIRAGKANEQVLVKRLADNYRKAGLSINFREYDGPYTFRNFEKYLYEQLRLLQANRRLLPRFAPSDDLEKLSVALKKMNATKLPFLDDVERSESSCDHSQCTHTTHRCHHAAHAYTGVPCAAYIGKGRKNGFLPRVNPLRSPGPTQRDPLTRSVMEGGNSQAMQISITPRADTQSPITLEVQQGANTQVFSLPTQSLDPSKNYYVSLSIKPNPSPNISTPPAPSQADINQALIDESGSISAPPPPAEPDAYVDVPLDRDKHNKSL